ncbi:MAG: pentapeptide repeat-containing protein, partial [Anaerolineae bacterium]|nr:pentapeptide repeat-containing protein [Anaerolineae bacterium]
DLRGALLVGADLSGAELNSTNLAQAVLINANLADALFVDVTFDASTTLPDGTHWTPDTDLSRFTDPDHPQFWRSDNPVSPAYREDSA